MSFGRFRLDCMRYSGVQGDNIIVYYYPQQIRLRSGSMQFFYDSVKNREDALWFLRIVKSAIKHLAPGIDAGDIADKVNKAMKTREAMRYEISISIKNLKDST